jgi:hypothetical protein
MDWLAQLVYEVACRVLRRVFRRPPDVWTSIEDSAARRAVGWWKVVVDRRTGRSWWTKVDAPEAGFPQLTVEQTPQTQPHPVEQTQPSPGTRLW